MSGGDPNLPGDAMPGDAMPADGPPPDGPPSDGIGADEPWGDLGDGLPLDYDLAGESGPAGLASLPERGPDEYLVLAPGEEVVVMSTLPKPRHLPTAFVVGTGVIALFDRTGRTWCRTPFGGATEHLDEPVAVAMALAVVRRPVAGPDSPAATSGRRRTGLGALVAGASARTDKRSHRYLVALDAVGDCVGALDNQPPDWELMPRLIARMAESVGLTFSAERFYSHEEFVTAHPGWLG